MSDVCDDFIYRFGTQVGVDGESTAAEMEEACKQATEETGYRHDWHNFAGRKIIKCSPFKVADDTPENRKRFEYMRKWDEHVSKGLPGIPGGMPESMVKEVLEEYSRRCAG